MRTLRARGGLAPCRGRADRGGERDRERDEEEREEEPSEVGREVLEVSQEDAELRGPDRTEAEHLVRPEELERSAPPPRGEGDVRGEAEKPEERRDEDLPASQQPPLPRGDEMDREGEDDRTGPEVREEGERDRRAEERQPGGSPPHHGLRVGEDRQDPEEESGRLRQDALREEERLPRHGRQEGRHQPRPPVEEELPQLAHEPDRADGEEDVRQVDPGLAEAGAVGEGPEPGKERRPVPLVDGRPGDPRRDPAGLRQVDGRVPPLDLGDPEGGDPEQRREGESSAQGPARIAAVRFGDRVPGRHRRFLLRPGRRDAAARRKDDPTGSPSLTRAPRDRDAARRSPSRRGTPGSSPRWPGRPAPV